MRSFVRQSGSVAALAVLAFGFFSAAPVRLFAADDKKPEKAAEPASSPANVQADSITEGSVTVNGQAIAYQAVAGTLTVGATNAQDALIGLDGKLLADSADKAPEKLDDAAPTARLFYAA